MDWIEKIYRFFHKSFFHPSLTLKRVILILFVLMLGLFSIQILTISAIKSPRVLFVGDLTSSSDLRFFGYIKSSFSDIDIHTSLPPDISSYSIICLLDGAKKNDSDKLSQYVMEGGSLVLRSVQILFLRQNSSSLALPDWLGFGNYTNGGYGYAVTLKDNILDSHLPNQTFLYENSLNNWTASVIDIIPEVATSVTILSTWFNSTTNTEGPVFSYTKEWHKTKGRLFYYGADAGDTGYGNESLWKNLDQFLVASIRWCTRLQETPSQGSAIILSEIEPSLYLGGWGAVQEGHPGNFTQIKIQLPPELKTSMFKNIQVFTELHSSQASDPLYLRFFTSSVPISSILWSNTQISTGEWNFSNQIGCLGSYQIPFSGSNLQFDISIPWITNEIDEFLYLIIENQHEYDFFLEKFQVEYNEYQESPDPIVFGIIITLTGVLGILTLTSFFSAIIFAQNQQHERKELTISTNNEYLKTLLPSDVVNAINALWQPLKETGISFKEAEILLCLATCSDNSASIRDLKTQLHLDYQIINYRTNQLINKELLRKYQDISDLRIMNCQLTEKGAEFVQKFHSSLNLVNNLKSD